MSENRVRGLLGRLIFSFSYLPTYPVIIFLLAGDWSWLEGWIFSAWFIAICAITITYLYFKDPALFAERFKKPGSGGQKKWDKYIIYLIMIGWLVWIILIPLDAKRFGWSPEFPLWIKIIGILMLIVSSYFFFNAFKDNTYLSPLVRIQTERKQKVISEGVYRIVRHPMYLGGALLFIGPPMIMGSIAGAVVGLLITFLLILRIIGEEKMLIEELEGYEDYKKKVKYRLIPFIW